ncbi:ATP-binding protein [Caldimonas brevitalea]|uniref:Virulence sensor protein BvgS n=1 Tax=Caldimonas brevitalea TaxID=413882 RepID=A0A0G3BII3_9BURK|nr:ATP-binding protein [Caldimonas brevitalea]AKJ29187.1 circadian input kinase A [Caldimonas brevitalea]
MKPFIPKPWHVVGLMAVSTGLVLSFWQDKSVADRLLPHGYCFTWSPTLLSMHVISDAVIGLAYVTIPLTLMHLVRRRGDLPFNWMFLLFALFIVSCGTTHFMEVWTVWRPNYWLSGSVKVVTAAASVLTAFALIRLVPQALGLPSVHHLKEAMAALEDEATRREQMLAEAERLRVAAEAASRAKSDFLATMSHEIRTPMNGILGTADLLVRAPLGERERALAETLLRSSRSLLGILNDILDLSKIEANELHVGAEAFDPRHLLEEVRDLFLSYAGSKGLELTIDIDPGVPHGVIGDPDRVRQVLSNLVSNAVKFASTGTVHLRLTARFGSGEGVSEPPTLRFQVDDPGPGIPPEARERLFQPFRQLDSSIARRHGGTGLGLAISQRLVQLMGGSIDFCSTPGEGTSFWFELPTPLAQAVPVPGPRQEPPELRFAHSGAAPLVPADPLQPLPEVGAPRILVVEDNPVNGLVLEAQLAGLGCACDVATDGEEALRRLEADGYDLVLMDCMLPGLSGYEVCQRWRTIERERGRGRVPIIALTANALASNAEEARAAGMDDFLTKPCTVDKLGRTVRRWLLGEGGNTLRRSKL